MDRLGAGGFATVWLYRDDELRSDVAVKALADNWSMRHDIRERFLAEARILRQADSDHVVRVYDIGEESGTPYFVMTYADRGTLANLLEPKQPLEPGRVAELIGQAGDGLSVLHDQGVIHRDIKPQNLLLKSDGSDRQRVLVADLGVAKAVVHASGLTQVVGTPAYMAPEQAMSEGLDIRADVHALAAVAYQMLTARLVREGGIADLLEATTPPPASSIAGVPSRVDDVLERALQPDRELRYPDIRSFVSDLSEACSSDTAIRTRPVARLRAGADAPGSDQTVRRRTDPDRPAKTPPPTTGRSTLVWALAALLVLAGTFALSYLVTTQLR